MEPGEEPIGTRTAARRAVRTAVRWLPRGQTLSEDVWRVRHRTLTWLLRIHVAGVFVFALIRGYSASSAFGYASIVGVFAMLAATDTKRRKFVSAMTALGLVTASGVLVDLSGGVTEMHFHFFVMVGILTLYQDWLPFLLAVGFVLVHHTLFGVVDPTGVYDHASAINNPLLWAGIHATFLLAASVASIVCWKLNEQGAFTDPLTRLPNRALFADRLGHALARVDRRPGVLAALFIDLDGFKGVNDKLGHAAGDQLLCRVADRIRGCIRAGDTAARLGGDEFAVLLEDVTNRQQAMAVADRVLAALMPPFTIAGMDVTIGASIGIAFNNDSHTVDGLVHDADVAMYCAKTTGRGHYEVFAPGMDAAAVGRAELEVQLRAAVRSGQFELHYQPIMGLGDGRCTGVEALLRWQHPDRGLLTPDDFIEVAETTGVIIELGAWVLEEACRQAQEWHDLVPGTHHLTVAVNLSPVQLLDPAIVDVVRAALDRSGLPPRALILELTESVMMNDSGPAAERLEELRALGVWLALDDFGTGYSALNYLRYLPFDILKIDRSFVDKINRSARDKVLVEGIVTMARGLELTIVAEGVEQADQAATLAELGCELAQGYLYCRPVPASRIAEMISGDKPPARWPAKLTAAS